MISYPMFRALHIPFPLRCICLPISKPFMLAILQEIHSVRKGSVVDGFTAVMKPSGDFGKLVSKLANTWDPEGRTTPVRFMLNIYELQHTTQHLLDWSWPILIAMA